MCGVLAALEMLLLHEGFVGGRRTLLTLLTSLTGLTVGACGAVRGPHFLGLGRGVAAPAGAVISCCVRPVADATG